MNALKLHRPARPFGRVASAVGLALVLSLLTANPAGMRVPAPALHAQLPVLGLVGVSPFSQRALEDFDAWNGRPADILMMYTNFDSWLHFDENIDHWIDVHSGDARERVWTIPLAVEATPLVEIAGGSNDGNFLRAAAKIRAASPGHGPIIIRLGHEFNFPTWPWHSKDAEAEYVAAYRRVHALFRRVSPRFHFEWNSGVALGTDEDLSLSYPGDAYVDVISLNLYWLRRHEVADPHAYWEKLMALRYGVKWIVAFARARSKPIAIPEWGTDIDDGRWVEIVADFIRGQPLVYHAYFDNFEDPDFETGISNGSKKEVGQAFIAAFGRQAGSEEL